MRTLFFVAPFAIVSLASAQDAYVLIDSASPSFRSIDLATAAQTTITNYNFSFQSNSLTYRAATDELYAINRLSGELATIDRTTGVITAVYPTGLGPFTWHRNGVAWDEATQLFYIAKGIPNTQVGQWGYSQVYTYDPATGQTILLGNTNSVMGLDTDANGDLFGVTYSATGDHLVQIDKTTGAETILWTYPASLIGFAIHPDTGVWYSMNGLHLLTIDPTTGQMTAIGPSQYGFLEILPEPPFTNYGAGCPGSTFTVSSCAELNPTGGTLTGTVAPLEFGILATTGVIDIESFDLFTQSTGGTQTVPAHIYPVFGTTPIASTTITVGPTPGFYTATFNPPVAVPVVNPPASSGVFLAIDVSAQTVFVPDLTTGSTAALWSSRPPGQSFWTGGGTLRPAYRVTCPQGTVYLTPAIGNVGNPVLGTTYDVTLSDALPSAGALSLTGFSDTQFQGRALPYALPNAPGCSVLASPHVTLFMFTSPTGTATHSITVPNFMGFIGVELFHQWAVVDAVNPLGLVVSDGGKSRIGS